jgi:tetratricopeptide (TPR) repeat protein
MRTTVNSFRTFCIVLILSLQLLAQSPSFDQAMQLFRQSHWAEAAAAFSECEKTDPGKTAALLYRGKALLNLGQLQDASAAIENYRQTYPRSDDAAYLLAYLRFRQNEPKESLQLFAAQFSLLFSRARLEEEVLIIKLKSARGETACILALSMLPSAFNENVTNASSMVCWRQ